MDAIPTNKVAFVTGANGISGYSIIEHLVRQPKQQWSKIIVTSRRSLPNAWIDPRVEFLAVDFLDPVEKIIAKLKDICVDTTHAFFTSYVHNDDFELLRDQNVPLFRNFLDAVDTVCPKLQRVCLQTGGKYYGVHLGPVKVPLEESFPRYDEHGYNFYYAQEDYLREIQKRRNMWSYNIIRPNAINGFAPHVWVASHDHCKDEVFNHTNGDVFVWKYIWPDFAAYFGLEVRTLLRLTFVRRILTTVSQVPEPIFDKATGQASTLANAIDMVEWAKDKRVVWEQIVKKYGGKVYAFDWGTWGFFNWATGKSWLTISSMSKAREFGWSRYDRTLDTWTETYRSFENAGVLPSRAALTKQA
ncbi:hypothetical protein CNMCM5878_007557 [Aspergillus fumigatiaffinis]|nr:hypothetical protein CNMCM5878_007557 [Aspergillus fumigatiaffinis]